MPGVAEDGRRLWRIGAGGGGLGLGLLSTPLTLRMLTGLRSTGACFFPPGGGVL